MMKITVEADTVGELAEQLMSLAVRFAPEDIQKAEPKAEPVQVPELKSGNGAEPKQRKKTEPKEKTAKPKATTAADIFGEAAPEPEENVTMIDVRRALTEYLAAHTEAETAALLQEHGGVPVLSKLPPDKFGAVYAAATK
jgi:hypothetical protein